MANYLLRRLVQGAVTLFGLTVFVFLMLRLLPGDPAMAVLPPGASQADLARMRHLMQLDRPLPIQYATWLSRLAHGDLGTSLQTRGPITTLLGQGLPATLKLAGIAIVLAIMIGIPLGLLAAMKPDTLTDFAVRLLAIFGFAVPNFWFAIVLILVFGVALRVLPTQGYGSLKNFVLPAATLTMPLMAVLASIVRAKALEVMREDYVRTAYAKGLHQRTVVFRHVLRNTFVELITIIGLQVAGLMGGSVVIETVFGWPGIGHMMFDAVAQRDYPVVQVMALLVGTTFLVVNLIVDLLYAAIDPRIRYA